MYTAFLREHCMFSSSTEITEVCLSVQLLVPWFPPSPSALSTLIGVWKPKFSMWVSWEDFFRDLGSCLDCSWPPGWCQFSDRNNTFSRYHFCKAGTNQSLRNCKSLWGLWWPFTAREGFLHLLKLLKVLLQLSYPQLLGTACFRSFSLYVNTFQISPNRETWHSPGSLKWKWLQRGPVAHWF